VQSAGAGALFGIGAKIRQWSHDTVELQYAAKEAGISVETMRGFGAAASARGIDSGAAIKGLQDFAAKADQIRNNADGIRAELLGWGEGELARAIIGAKDNQQALFKVLERVAELRNVAPDRARFIADTLLGDLSLAGIGKTDVQRWASMFNVLTREERDKLEKIDDAFTGLENAFDQFKVKMGIATVPGFTKAIENLSKIYTQHPEAFAPIVTGLEGVGKSMKHLIGLDWAQTGHAFAAMIRNSLRAASWIYRQLKWAEGMLDTPQTRRCRLPVPRLAQLLGRTSTSTASRVMPSRISSNDRSATNSVSTNTGSPPVRCATGSSGGSTAVSAFANCGRAVAHVRGS
jgi:hypothetical protein